MSLWILPLLAVALLALPIVFRPRAPKDWEFSGFLAFLWYLNAAYCAIFHRLVTEPAPLPKTGPAILIANHTCNIDHFLLQVGTGRKLGFMIARDYYDIWAFRPFCRMIGCIPVNRDGKDTTATRTALRALKEGRVLPIFPEGHILKTSGEEIGEGKPGVAFLATRAKVPVVPAYIRGTPRENYFLRSFFSFSHAKVYYGEPIDPSLFVIPEGHDAERAALKATTQAMMDAIRALRDRAELEEAAG
jgi:1-acyl-sn-glycerol-3-phosphate acyltransferase